MLKMEEFFMLRDLYSQGMSVSEISRHTGIDRKTVRKYVKSDSLPVATGRCSRASKLDGFKEYIVERLNEYPLSAVRLFEEIREKGYTGGYTVVKDFVRSVKPNLGVPAVLRFETKPGLQAQVDWAELAHIEIDGVQRKLYCFTMILGYSRMRYAELTLSTDTATLIKCHLNAFEYYGGCPREILYDNMKQVVIRKALQSRDNVWNPLFKDFYEYTGFVPRLCRPRRPQTKGKVENTVKYVKGGFFNGRQFNSLRDIETGLKEWLHRVNFERVHGTTHCIPGERWKQEDLNQITVPYRVVVKETRKISRESMVSYRGNLYSVPYRMAGRTATIQVIDGMLKILVNDEEVCGHELLTGTGRVSRDRAHFQGLLAEIMKEGERVRKERLPVLKFVPVRVEERSLSVYEALCGDSI